MTPTPTQWLDSHTAIVPQHEGSTSDRRLYRAYCADTGHHPTWAEWRRHLGTWIIARRDAGIARLGEPDGSVRYLGLVVVDEQPEPHIAVVHTTTPRPRQRPTVDRRAEAAVMRYLDRTAWRGGGWTA